MKKKEFEKPFIKIQEEADGINVVYSRTGNFSAIFKIKNLSPQFSANKDYYENYHLLFGQIVKLLGDGYTIQKTDIIASQIFENKQPAADYLTKKYFDHFQGRIYKEITTYLTITKDTPKGRFFSYEPKHLKDFLDKVNKINDTISNQKIQCSLLSKKEIELLFNRFFAFNFTDNQFGIGNLSCDDKGVYYSDKTVKSISLIDIDEINLPSEVSTFTTSQELGKTFPLDNLSFILNAKVNTIVYNQVIKIPDQRKTKTDLELKKKRHSTMPDPANDLSVVDIDNMFIDIAQNNELLVYAHFNILVCDKKENIEKAVNAVENQLFALGIIPGKNTYNQMELFRCAIPCNAEELRDYDLFLTSRPAAVCFFFKESLPKSEDSDYLLWFTDRQGLPVGIDTSELPMHTGRINNRNRFILGPSGSGKSFFTNSYVKQCYERGADIVLVDTGNSYKGLCKYFGGRYITYTQDKPITMNPFNIGKTELNIEKIQLLVSLIVLIWKGVKGEVSVTEQNVLTNCVFAYFRSYFNKNGETLELSPDEITSETAKEKEARKTAMEAINKLSVETSAIVTELSFNSFYRFSVGYIKDLIKEKEIESYFDIKQYAFNISDFYEGGIYDTILNDNVDTTLFNEQFIVFEIDNIKEHPLLFPITTLIIMDVFIQKMRHKANKKILVIEEAWKAIANEKMAGNILYLYKTVRKFAGEAIVVTQELNDIIGNEIVKDSIISNSDTICLLDQTKFKDTFETISQLLSLNEVEQNKIFTINRLDNKEDRSRFKEVYIKRGAIGEVYGVEVPTEEYLTYTTERSEKEALEIYMNTYEDYETAMDSFVQDLKESDMPLPMFVKHINKNEAVFRERKVEIEISAQTALSV